MAGARVVCLLGATGTGKTEAAIALAAAFDGEVVNVDSRQVYAGIPIITAQPTPDELARCPHHLYGDTPLDKTVAAGDFAVRARAAAAAIHARGRLPLFVGGTGLYFRAILGGLAPIPAIAPDVRAAVLADWERLGPAAMHAKLAALDPAYAARIAPADRQRVTRALEVSQATGRAFSDWHKQGDPDAPDYDVVKIGLSLPLEELIPRLAQRIEAMVAAEAVAEVARALARYPADAPGLTGIGGPEIAAHLAGVRNLKETKEAWLSNTRAYAKRQATWFRKEPAVLWLAPGDHQGIRDAVGRHFARQGA
ncbi:tRNA (adenosine(37)-N6)-dimethylallyltransferase MiaA [Desulfovibrio aerotolerans]|uniref:tRNA dimethylallyltransferase n=1 Tax=Solidesulfovibrio aerotolerans TaxID=295255 RepID=A0A7C9J891_9BACT|nr:tRNA (adenosine(37)-N6)-dimethylallyltransferase MiaA [Solidesulfovibrio aerotolerans]